ncbi:MAG: glycerate kinase [Muribaculaceae bacterium]|nr:glycerate kinase [Muribaculaceae bacterium]
MDSFKGSLTASEATNACAEAIRELLPDCDVVELPMADGGEGFASIISANRDNGGKFIPIKLVVNGPLSTPINVCYFYNSKRQLAIMEVAEAAGLTLVREGERNPLKTSSFGVGEMILDAINRGARDIILGLGGSATNDAGMGLLSAIGFKFADKSGRVLRGCGENLKNIYSIDISSVNKNIFDISLIVACDVNNPLLGENGATHIYGPQKGADNDMVRQLENGMVNFANIYKHGKLIANENHKDEDMTNLLDRLSKMAELPGAGAAGGIGGSLYAFLNAQLKHGIDVTLDYAHFDDEIEDADLIITGEGSLDAQTVNGKVALGILNRAKNKNIPVIAIGGQLKDSEKLFEAGFTSSFSIINTPLTLPECLSANNTKHNINITTKQMINLINYFKN